MSFMSNFTFYWRTTGSFCLSFKIYLHVALRNLENLLRLPTILSSSISIVKRPIIATTPTGTYVCMDKLQLFQLSPSREAETKKYIEKHSKKYAKETDKIFVNIGANIGSHFIPTIKKGYKGFAFEAAPQNHRLVLLNMLLSDVKGTCYDVALGSKNGSCSFDYYPELDGMSRVHGTYYQGEKSAIKSTKQILQVPLRTFDSYASEITFSKVRLMLIDVEGYELEVLKGMKTFLSQVKKMDMIIEIWKDHQRYDETVNLLKSYGFSMRHLAKNDWLFSK